MATYQFTVVVARDEDGVYIATCPALPCCYSQGDMYQEAIENLKDAIKLHLEARQSLGEPISIEVALDRLDRIEVNA